MQVKRGGVRVRQLRVCLGTVYDSPSPSGSAYVLPSGDMLETVSFRVRAIRRSLPEVSATLVTFWLIDRSISLPFVVSLVPSTPNFKISPTCEELAPFGAVLICLIALSSSRKRQRGDDLNLVYQEIAQCRSCVRWARPMAAMGADIWPRRVAARPGPKEVPNAWLNVHLRTCLRFALMRAKDLSHAARTRLTVAQGRSLSAAERLAWRPCDDPALRSLYLHSATQCCSITGKAAPTSVSLTNVKIMLVLYLSIA